MSGMPRTEVPLASPSQQAREPAGRTQQALGTPVLPEAPAPTPAVAPPTRITLADPRLASTTAKRAQRTSLVRCALPAAVTLYAEHDGTRVTFPGGLGLAPRWVDEALTPSEERWVSACLLAHVNAFGTSVLVSMRATPPPTPALAVSDAESRRCSLFEILETLGAQVWLTGADPAAFAELRRRAAMFQISSGQASAIA